MPERRARTTCPYKGCGESALRVCSCPLKDAECAASHRYFLCAVHGLPVLRPVSHAHDAQGCSCGTEASGPKPRRPKAR